MRASLIESLASRGAQDVEHPKGAVILCCACLRPLYVVQRTIYSGESVGRSIELGKWRPVTLADLTALEDRLDQPMVAALIRHWTPEQRVQHVTHIAEPFKGMQALCPCCGLSIPRVRATEAAEVIDQTYVWELVTITPKDSIPDTVARAWAM